jgi:phosphoglycolate phosphatase
LKIGPPTFSPRLVIFDKDGTLIDFQYMWAAWIAQLAQRLEVASGLPVSTHLFTSFGFDPDSSRISHDGPLAVWSMAALRQLAVDILSDVGLARKSAESAVAAGWYTPDPVKFARPLADLPRLFGKLSAEGVKTAVATSDDRAATLATLGGLGIARYVAAVVGADDGLPTKPAPDMVLYLCRRLGIEPADSVVVGDAVADMMMGRAAGVGLTVGVLSGVGTREILAPFADVVVPSVGELV